jgi:thiol oxidase
VISNYVIHFLQCRECAGHFAKMSATAADEVFRPSDGVLWLWRAHNKANLRLKGDVSEDPAHPKIQFPSVTACPRCHSGGTVQAGGVWWNENEVLNYLKEFYGSDHVIRDVIQSNFSRTVSATTGKIYYNFNLDHFY